MLKGVAALSVFVIGVVGGHVGGFVATHELVTLPWELLATLDRHTDVVRSLAFTPDGSSLVSASWDGTVKLWDTGSHELKMTLAHAAEVDLVTWSADGSVLASASWDQALTLWDAATGERISRQTVALPITVIGAVNATAPAAPAPAPSRSSSR